MHILFVSPEVFPFAKTGGLADVLGILPQAIAKRGHTCSTILPFYRTVHQSGLKPKLVKEGVSLRSGDGSDAFDLYSVKRGSVTVYFIKKDEYYDREFLYGTPQGDYPDNAARFSFFSKAVLASAAHIGKIDILHLDDWQTGLIPLYLKLFHKQDPHLKAAKTLFSIHNLAYQGLFAKDVMPSINLPEELFTADALEFYGKISFMKAATLRM